MYLYQQLIACMYVCVYKCLIFLVTFFHFPGKGEDKEYPTIGARLIRLEDKVGTLLALSVCVLSVQVREIN